MKTALFRGFLSFLTLRQCHAAVTWRTVGCEGWSFDGVSMDAIWDNAILMATNAQSQINAVPTGRGVPLNDNGRRARANVDFMFGVNINPLTGINSAGTQALQNANTMYTDIERGLRGTLTGVDVNNAFLFCDNNGLTEGIVPGSPVERPIWHAQLRNGDTTEYIILQYASFANSQKPCAEDVQDNKYEAKTFDAIKIVNGEDQRFVGMILCPNRFRESKVPVVPTLAQGFTAAPSGGNKYASPDDYISLAGTIVHEMTHVVGRTRGTTYIDRAYLFDGCLDLAKNNQPTALVNPDNYRIFAEMSMSPKTKWGAKDPKKGGS